MKYPTYKHRGARALVMLHEHHLHEFIDIWRDAKAVDLDIVEKGNSQYESLESVLRHVLSSAGNYMKWICQELELPDPEIRRAPDVDVIEEEAEDYIEHLIERWSTPLADIPEKSFYHPTHTSRWKVEYCIDAMMEHAVMHPIRHTFQFEELMEKFED